MKVKYDFHIHSALSPCAEDDMTPCNIVGLAKYLGLDMIAVADHNAIENVKTAMLVGDCYGVTVVPAIELQTAEDIHILCLFKDYQSLSDFYNAIDFIYVPNKSHIFGNQNIVNDDDEVVGTLDRLLLNASRVSCSDVKALVDKFGGAAVPAHIDRDANGMLSILGAVTDEFTAVELSLTAPNAMLEKYSASHRLIIDSDAHTLDSISEGRVIELESPTPKALIDYLNGL
ncbi:MAG: phosphoesterase [Clostridia bacterium]|nr:phosphoesterase [Clostridia bacterium]